LALQVLQAFHGRSFPKSALLSTHVRGNRGETTRPV
jgi:hypothetical protein